VGCGAVATERGQAVDKGLMAEMAMSHLTV
jgi:hypothetical protein